MKTSNLTGCALDWAVAMCRGFEGLDEDGWLLRDGISDMPLSAYNPSTDWKQGGPIIEREKLCIDIDSAGVWLAWTKQNYADEARHMVSGPTPLIAATRCYVASVLGDEVEIPDSLV